MGAWELPVADASSATVLPHLRRPLLFLSPPQVLELSLRQDEAAAREALESLIELVEAHPLFLRPVVGPACEAMLSVTCHADFDEETRGLGLEFLLKMAEHAPATGACH